MRLVTTHARRNDYYTSQSLGHTMLRPSPSPLVSFVFDLRPQVDLTLAVIYQLYTYMQGFEEEYDVYHGV
jgi:hypothetical protein